jgi:predicted  nucleic acid-binding Zn-ribbon protein
VDRIPTNTINELTKKGDSSRSKRPSDVLQTHAKDVKDVGDIQSLEKKKTELSNIDRQIETQEKESIKEFDRALKDLNQSKSQAERSIGSLTTEIKALQEYVTSLSKQFLGAQQLKLSEAHRGKAIPDSIKTVIEEARKRVQQANTQIREVNKSGTVLRIQESDTSKYIWKEVK